MAQQPSPQSGDQRLLNRFLREFHPSRLLPSLAAGLVMGILLVVVAVSFAALIFSGQLVDFLPIGIGIALFSAVVFGVVVALLSSFPGAVAIPQDSPAAILAFIAASIAGSVAASTSAEDRFLTVMAAVALASILTGVFFLSLGLLKLGGLTRFMPYPVVGGFLAGTGWLLVQGSFGVMADTSLGFAQLPYLFQSDVLARWLSGLFFAVFLIVIMRRYSHFLIMPGALLAAMALFYVVLLLTGTSIAEAGEQGWLLEAPPGAGLWQLRTFTALTRADWPAIFGQVGGLATILIVSVVSALLNASGIEVAVEQDIDLNHELQVAGIANLVSGLGGGMPGYHALSLSVLGHRMGTNSRLVGLFSALVCAVVLIFGASILTYFPKPVLGGLLMFLGLSFLVEWVYDAWFKLPRADYVVVLLIVGVVAVFGFLEGVGVGLLAAIALFVANYSRIDVVKHVLTGENRRSNVERPLLYRQLLRQKGQWLYILELQGYIFFGTANRLLDQVHRRVDDPELSSPRYVVLDFRLVSGLDSSAVLSFAKMKQLAQAKDFVLVFTQLASGIRRQMEKELFEDGADTVWRIFPDLDRGLEWCENQMIQVFESVGLAAKPKTLMKQLEEVLPGSTPVASLMKYLERQDVKEGYTLIQQGKLIQCLYFIEAGQVTVRLMLAEGKEVRLRTMGAGTIVGELGMYLGNEATASVVTDQPSTVFSLSDSALREMERNDPEVANAFHRFIVRLLAERLTDHNRTLEALLS